MHNPAMPLRIATALRRFADARDGVAFLEFGLAFPLLLILLLGGVEVARYVQAAQKVDKLTHTIVDLVAQAPTISVPDMNQIMIAAQHVMTPLPFDEDGVIIVSCVGYNDLNQLVIKWQYKGGGSLIRDSKIGTVNATPTLPDGFTVENRDNVIIAETYYYFEPIVNEEIVQPIDFYRTAFYLPRLGELDVLNP